MYLLSLVLPVFPKVLRRRRVSPLSTEGSPLLHLRLWTPTYVLFVTCLLTRSVSLFGKFPDFSSQWYPTRPLTHTNPLPFSGLFKDL